MVWSADIVDQLDFYWNTHLRPRLAGLTDEEYLWEPVGGMWSVRHCRGRLRPDLVSPQPPLPPVTTIAWRLDHVTRGVLGMRARALFGGSPAEGASADMYDERHWPEPIPADAAGALASLEYAYALWHAGAAALDDLAMTAPLGPVGAAYANSSMAQLVLHVNREVMAHGAEICLLRDLYRAEQDDRDVLVAAALRGDADAVRALGPAGARRTLVAEAAGLHRWEVVRALVEAGAPTDGVLHYAAAAGQREIAELLVAHGADLDAADARFGQTPAAWAEYYGHGEPADRLRP